MSGNILIDTNIVLYLLEGDKKIAKNLNHYLNPANKAKPCCRNRLEMVESPRVSRYFKNKNT